MSDSSPHAESPAPVVKVRRGTEAGDAPAGQGATRLRQGCGVASPKFAVKPGERRRATENTYICEIGSRTSE